MNPVRTMQESIPPMSLHIMSFSQRMIALRRERGLTQQAFADATGIHVQQIKRNEADTSQPSVEALKKIAKCFGVTTDWLLFEDAERGPDEDLRLQFEAMGQLTPEEKEVARVRANEFFGEMSLLTGEPRRASVRAATGCRLFVIDHDSFKSVLSQNPEVARAISEKVAERAAISARKSDAAGPAVPVSSTDLFERIRRFFGKR